MFAYLYRTLFAELLQSDDDFFTRCRKAVITGYFVFGIINILMDTASAVFQGEWLVLDAVNATFFYIFYLICIASWAYTKRTRTSPDWLMNLIVDVNLCIGIFMHFSSPPGVTMLLF